MKTSFALRIAFVLAVVAMFGAFAPALAQKDPAAKAKLDKMSAKYKAYKTMTVAFSLNLNNQKAKLQRTQTGKAFLKGAKFRVEMGDQTLFSDGKNLYTYLKDANEINISTFKATDDINPANLFTMYQTGYKYTMVKDAKATAKGQTVIDLVPEDAKKQVFKVRLFIKTTTNELMMAQVFEKSGTQYTYTLSSVTPNKPLDESLFTLDKKKYPGVTVTDLR